MITQLKQEDFEDMKEWFKFFKWDCPPLECLPDTTYILVEENIKIGAVSLYHCVSGNIGFTEWFIVNPKAPRHLRKNFIDKLLTHVFNQARERKLKFLLCTTKNKNLARNLINNGYLETDQNITNFIKSL